MEKIICNICGTSYPDTADCCPICGFGKDGKLFEPVDEILLEEESAEQVHETAKGGRFSRANAGKRSDAVPAKAPFQDEDDDGEYGEPTPPDNKDKQGSNMGLIVTLVVLLIAIVAVIIYIYLSFFAPQGEKKPNAETTEPKTSTTQQTNTDPAVIPCTALNVSETVITLDAIGNAWLLNVVPMPENTTDVITYHSDNEAVATVSETGRITAVSPGTATVTVTCGGITVQCSVTCTVPTEATTEPTTAPTTEPTTEPTTAPTTVPTTAPTEPEREWNLNRTEIMFSDKYPTPWTLYTGSVSKNKITFTSDDESVATFINGVVTPIGNGKTTVRATYNGETLTCTVWVNFKTQGTEPTETITATTTAATTATTTAATTTTTTSATATTEAAASTTEGVG